MPDPTTETERYRKIAVRLWRDKTFRALPERARHLWLYLLTAPETTAVPGLFPTSAGTIADALQWTPDEVRTMFAHIEAAGMAKVDWTAGVVWIPRAVTYNEPPNPNVTLSWRMHMGLLPESPIVTDAVAAFAQYMATRGGGFPGAFRQALGSLSRKAFPPGFRLISAPQPQPIQPTVNTTVAHNGKNPGAYPGGNQEQEQEQEHTLFSESFQNSKPSRVPAPAREPGGPKSAASADPEAIDTDAYAPLRLAARTGSPASACAQAVREALQAGVPADAIERSIAALADSAAGLSPWEWKRRLVREYAPATESEHEPKSPDSGGVLLAQLSADRAKEAALNAGFLASGYTSRRAYAADVAHDAVRTGDAAPRRAWTLALGTHDLPPAAKAPSP